MSKIEIQLEDNIACVNSYDHLVGEVCLDLKDELPPGTKVCLKFIGTERLEFLFEAQVNSQKGLTVDSN